MLRIDTQKIIKFLIDLFIVLSMISISVWWGFLFNDATSCSEIIYGSSTKLAGNISASFAFVVVVLSQYKSYVYARTDD